MALPQLCWDVDFLKDNPMLQDESFGIPVEIKHIHYPTRLLRYWFMYQFLREETARNGTPSAVCEIGVDTGQMLRFMHAAASSGGERVEFAGWEAVDCLIRREILEKAGYNQFYQVELESPEFKLDKQYDVMIMLHVLEHLFKPEELVSKLAPHLKPGGIMIGGFPSVPHFMECLREKEIRPKARRFGHVSVFSPYRVRRMAAANGLEVEFLSGAFFMRKKGFFLENCKWWLRFNLWFGAMFPNWPGEIYWLLRKPKSKP